MPSSAGGNATIQQPDRGHSGSSRTARPQDVEASHAPNPERPTQLAPDSPANPGRAVQPPTLKPGLPLHNRVRSLADRFESGSPTTTPPQPRSSPDDPVTVQQEIEGPASHRPSAPPRDASFRPVLPGGWVSYGPSVDGNTTPLTTEEDTSKGHSSEGVRTITPSETTDGPNDPSPFAGRASPDGTEMNHFSNPSQHPPPLATRMASACPERSESPSSPTATEKSHMEPAAGTRSSVEKMAPLESDLSKTPVDTSVPPTPPPKDSPPSDMSPASRSDYFTTPLAPRRRSRGLQPSVVDQRPNFEPPPVLPHLSTDNSPHDQESDKLRKEIVRSLNLPDLGSAAAPPSSWDQYEPESPHQASDSEPVERNRDSTALPSEYDSYWATIGDESEPDLSLALPGSQQQQPQTTDESRPAPLTMSTASDMTGAREVAAQGHPLSREMGSQDQNSIALPARQLPVPPSEAGDESEVKNGIQDTQRSRDLPLSGAAAPSMDNYRPYTRSSQRAFDGDLENRGVSDVERPSVDRPEVAKGEGLLPSTAPATGLHRVSPQIGESTAGVDIPDGSRSTNVESSSSSVRYDELMGSSQNVPAELPARETVRTDAGPLSENPTRAENDPPNAVGAPITSGSGVDNSIPGVSAHPTPSENERYDMQVPPSTRTSSERPSSTSTFAAEPVRGTQRVLSAQEISVLKTPHERIQAYNTARQHYAARHAGLTAWLTMMMRSPPHFVGTHPTASSSSSPAQLALPQSPHRKSGDTTHPLLPGIQTSRSDLASSSATTTTTTNTATIPAGSSGPSSAPAVQQPYYQQYLHFSDLTPSTTTTTTQQGPFTHSAPPRAPGPSSYGVVGGSGSASGGGTGAGPNEISPTTSGAAGGSGSGSGPGVGRLTSHQVQTRGKDLLHTAGVLGGKANVAAKGLFSKGKSRFRTSGADKGDH